MRLPLSHVRPSMHHTAHVAVALFLDASHWMLTSPNPGMCRKPRAEGWRRVSAAILKPIAPCGEGLGMQFCALHHAAYLGIS